MFNCQVVFLAALSSASFFQVQAQGFFSTYNTPFQNSFAFATPNLKQVFTTKLASGSRLQPFSQLPQDQQVYNSPQQNAFANFQHLGNLPSNYYPSQNDGVYSTAPQQFQRHDQLRQQLGYYNQQEQLRKQLQLQQIQQQEQVQQKQQQQQQQYLEQFQEPFTASQRDNNFERQANQESQEVRTSNLLGVAYSPSTQVSKVKFDNGKLKYDF